MLIHFNHLPPLPQGIIQGTTSEMEHLLTDSQQSQGWGWATLLLCPQVRAKTGDTPHLSGSQQLLATTISTARRWPAVGSWGFPCWTAAPTGECQGNAHFAAHTVSLPWFPQNYVFWVLYCFRQYIGKRTIIWELWFLLYLLFSVTTEKDDFHKPMLF